MHDAAEIYPLHLPNNTHSAGDIHLILPDSNIGTDKGSYVTVNIERIKIKWHMYAYTILYFILREQGLKEKFLSFSLSINGRLNQ